MLVSVSVLDSRRDHNPKRRKEMKKVRFNYWKLTAVLFSQSNVVVHQQSQESHQLVRDLRRSGRDGSVGRSGNPAPRRLTHNFPLG